MKYRSSYWTYFLKYLFVPVWTGVFLHGITSTWNCPNEFQHKWSRGAAMIISYALLWLIPLVLRLRFVELYEGKMVVRGFRKSLDVSYEAIEWLYEIVIMNPQMISIKLKDDFNLPLRKLFIIPAEKSSFRIFGEGEVVKFIRQQVIKAQPSYSPSNEPSRWFPLFLLLGTVVPLVFVMEKLHLFP